MKKICAIYTRKSTDERLDMEFNTLDAQRESCEAYIISQKSEGWVTSKDKYDDGGFSGGSLERPALTRLIEDIKSKKIHTIVVYKIDRLTRSLMDFAKLVQVFDEYGVTFVSITQSFNTTTSMGRLTLNVLLSFAQFEREVSGERIRDKIAASKARGMWMGGVPPVGYKIENRQLIINPNETALARHIFDRYLALGNVRSLKAELDREGYKSPARVSLKNKPHGDARFSRGALYAILKNPAYIGKIRHKDKIHDGLHDGIILPDIWDRVQNKLKDQAVNRTAPTQRRYCLQGRIFDMDGTGFSPTFTKRHNREYCYYISRNFIKRQQRPGGSISRVPAHELETIVEQTIRERVEELLPPETEPDIVDHILKNQATIPTPDLIKSCVERVIIGFNQITIKVNPSQLYQIIEKEFKVRIPTQSARIELEIPFKMGKAKRGAVVIQPTDTHPDVLDLPPEKIKKVVQGIIWRDEHFGGMTLRDISLREKCSEAYVGTAIFLGFDVLSKPFPISYS